MKSSKKIKSCILKKNKPAAKIKGFTLVELIIVIAIIGILAAILIPTMTGKVKQAKLTTANDGATKVANAASIVLTELETDGTPIDSNSKCCYSALNFNITGTGLSDDDAEVFRNLLEKQMPKLKDSDVFWAIAFDDNGGVLAAAYCEKGSNYIGTYPKQATEPINNLSGATPPNSSEGLQNYLMLGVAGWKKT